MDIVESKLLCSDKIKLFVDICEGNKSNNINPLTANLLLLAQKKIFLMFLEINLLRFQSLKI